MSRPVEIEPVAPVTEESFDDADVFEYIAVRQQSASLGEHIAGVYLRLGSLSENLQFEEFATCISCVYYIFSFSFRDRKPRLRLHRDHALRDRRG